ncbi:hypothetical protein O6H91_10G070600 [Diphasiastrum complanatum]|uniref:Uncharacterized protein n=2 Tax=Diphasiastrum complanatum TaxID=34168 RepID=A0ACC2CI59_DIPCM|nr:hypothetical protein O6H91_10G070600 [Diphasiastrum complanatum]KAJ7541682.1 hypothetical protein O6H91_10G070600 [Diphasiastrum complanatum]
MKGQEGDARNPKSPVPLTPQVRRSARKSTSSKTCNIQVDSVVRVTKYSGDADVQEERQRNKEVGLVTSDCLPPVRRSTRKSNLSQSSDNQVHSKVRASRYSGNVDSQEERQGDKELGLATSNDYVQVRRSTRKSKLSQTSNIQFDSEVQASVYSGDKNAWEERQGAEQLSLVSLDGDAVLEADCSEREGCKQSWINNEQEEREVSRRILTTNSDHVIQQKNLEDCSEREGCKESLIDDEQDGREVSQQILTTNSDDQKQQKNLENSKSSTQEPMMSETHDQFNDTEDSEEDDDKMATLLSKVLCSQLSKKSICSTQGSVQEQHNLQDAKNGERSSTIPRTDTIHMDGERPRVTAASVSSLKVSWSPSYGLPFLDDKQQRGKKGAYGQDGVILQHNKSHQPLGSSEGQLQDGLFVPPNDMRKLKKMLKKEVADTAGDKWFYMPAPTITPELKKELQLLKLRSVINPKRHYKAEDSKTLPKYFQIGTVVEGPADFFSGRLTNKERKATFADELLSNTDLARYRCGHFCIHGIS